MENEDNVFEVLPTGPEDQLTMAIQIIKKSFRENSENYKKEIEQIKEFAKQQQVEINEVKEQNQRLEEQLLQKEKIIKQIEEEKTILKTEKDQLLNQIKKMTRENQKLLTFKKAILSSINQEKIEEEIIPNASFEKKEDSFSEMYSPSLSRTNNVLIEDSVDEGKEFFKKAKDQLSFKQFNQFLNCIKLLNSGKQTKSETLIQAKKIFGEENLELYSSFETLLEKHF